MDSILTPRTVFTSALRRALRPRALMGAAALVLLPLAAAGCATPATTVGAAARPASTPASTEPVAAARVVDDGGAGGSAPRSGDVRRSAPAGTARNLSWPQLNWYSEPEYGGTSDTPARVWRSTPEGRWELVREGRPADPKAEGKVAASPDGRRMAWRSANPNQLMTSAFEGGPVTTVPAPGDRGCAPRWLDNQTVTYTEGAQGDWTVVGVRPDGKGRHVLASQESKCPFVGNGVVAFVQDRALRIAEGGGSSYRIVQPRIPAELKIHGVAGFSPDGRQAVISTHVPNAGECGCTWRIRNYRVEIGTGVATELTPLDPAWRGETGRGQAEQVRFLPGGTMIAQINTATLGDDVPAYQLVRYAADGRVLGSLPVPAGTPWGRLLG
ncbi:hypothetical protein AB0C04_01105 [Micromonospora sp. NPDC048909]|uniref:hypothetical protein n=1 Tax=Micromonospora sp. NPDC048909 TaxID=3155643 RepID=UPI0033E1AA98